MVVASRPAPEMMSEGVEGRETARVGTGAAEGVVRASSEEGEEGMVLASEAGSAGEASSASSSVERGVEVESEAGGKVLASKPQVMHWKALELWERETGQLKPEARRSGSRKTHAFASRFLSITGASIDPTAPPACIEMQMVSFESHGAKK